MLLVSIALGAIALVCFIPVLVLLIECLAAVLLPQHPGKSFTISRAIPSPVAPRTAVLIPAHNEAIGIQSVIASLLPQLAPQDQLIVIADNCTDETAAIARTAGATVIERSDPTKRGKGYALDYGLKHLANNPPEVVAIIDADCRVDPGVLEQIARQANATGRPAQAIYLMDLPAEQSREATAKTAISALAFMVKNLVRPRVLNDLGWPCPLTGTGMAFPWHLIASAPLASGNIVEDMQLGIDLAIAGYPTSVCEGARVFGMLPRQEQAAKGQRTRWEHGHLQTLLTQVPLLLQQAIVRRRLDLLVMGLDLAVPPLSLLVLGLVGFTLLAGLTALGGGSWLPTLIFLGETGLVAIAILVAWAKFGRQGLPAKTLLSIPFYIFWKLPLYLSFLKARQQQWVRTERDAMN